MIEWLACIAWSLGAIQGWRILGGFVAAGFCWDLEGIDWFLIIVFGGMIAFCVWPIILCARLGYVLYVKYELGEKRLSERFAKTILADTEVKTREEKRAEKTKRLEREVQELRGQLSNIHHADL